MSQFRLGKFDDAINSFIELDLNPAKVVALYPERIAGRLSVPPDDWISLFGGPANQQSLTSKNDDAMSIRSQYEGNESKEKLLESSLSPATPVRAAVRRGTALVALLSSSKDKDDDAVSISGKKKVKHVGQSDILSSLTRRVNKFSRRLQPVGGLSMAISYRSSSESCRRTRSSTHCTSSVSPVAFPLRDIDRRIVCTAEHSFGSLDSRATCAVRADCGHSALQVLSCDSASPPRRTLSIGQLV